MREAFNEAPPSNLKGEHYADLLGGESTHHDETLCVVCMDSSRDTLLVPCGHVVLCSGCAQRIADSFKECPMCCAEIASVINL